MYKVQNTPVEDTRYTQIRDKLQPLLNKQFSTIRNGIKKTVYLVEVKKRDVVVKDKLTDAHSSSKNMVEFDRYYKLSPDQ